jgi:ferredoxin-thioredoxin reductase catalytic subunit
VHGEKKYIRTASLPCRILSAQKDLNDAAVVPCIHKEIEEKDNDHSKQCRTVSIFQVEVSKSFRWE